MPKWIFLDDIDEVIDNLYLDEEFSKDISLIMEKQQELRKLQKQLPEPPKGYEEFDEDINCLMDYWIELSMYLSQPEGNYMDMKEKFNELFREQNELLQELESYE